MDNKLQQLTRKLYEEGLEKGRAQADTLIEEAKKQAAALIADARAQAAEIVAAAEKKADEKARNSANEVALASRQSIAALKKAITSMVSAKTIDAPLAQLSLNADFIRDMILRLAAGNGTGELTAQLPADQKERFESALKGSLAKLLAAGVELEYSDGVKSGFRIGPREGGYYIGFTDADLRALMESYLRPEAARILFDE